MTRFTPPSPLECLTAFAAALTACLLTALPAAAQTPPCSVTVANIWSDDPERTFDTTTNTLKVEEGAYWEFDLKYSCVGDLGGAGPVVSIIKPSATRFDTPDFRGGISEVDGVADGDALTGDCLTADGCLIEIFGTSKDNNCRNQGATVQRMRAETRIINTRSGDLNLTDLLTVTIEARDDDTLSQKYLDMGYTQWKPLCD